MQNTKTAPKSVEQKRPPVSPLIDEWVKHPQRITDAIIDTAASIEIGKAMRHELDACGRGDVDPDSPGLTMLWAYLAMAGAHGLLDRQRRWHRLHGRGGGR